MRLTQLQYLLEIKKWGSISKAAQHLFMAQPSMSAAIKELEEELGYELMKRSKKGVTFTMLGEQVAEKADNIIREMEAIRCLNREQVGTMSGRIFLAAIPFVCEHFMLDLIIQLKEQYPQLHVLLDENDAHAIFQQIDCREADLGIVMICNNEEERYQRELEKNHLVFVELYQDEMYFWAGQQNPYYGKGQAALAEILQYPYVYYKDSFSEEDRLFFGQYCDWKQLETVRMKDKESVKKYVMRSQAVTAMPYSASKDNIYLQTGLLKPLRITDARWTCRIGVVYRKDTPLVREEIFLLEQLQRLLAERLPEMMGEPHNHAN